MSALDTAAAMAVRRCLEARAGESVTLHSLVTMSGLGNTPSGLRKVVYEVGKLRRAGLVVNVARGVYRYDGPIDHGRDGAMAGDLYEVVGTVDGGIVLRDGNGVLYVAVRMGNQLDALIGRKGR